MGSTRLSLGLCIVMLLGAIAVLPGAVTAQEEEVTLSVTIVDQNEQSVGGGISVMATWDGGSANGTTAPNGEVLLAVPRGADVSIQIDDDTYIRNSAYVVENATETDVDVPVAQSGTATVTVRDADGQPVENAQVWLYQSGQSIVNERTDADGNVTTQPIEEGRYGLTVRKDGYYSNRSSVQVSGQTVTNRTIEQGSVFLTVSVVDDYFEPPQSRNASVRIPSITTFNTGPDGEYSAQVPVNTDYELTVTRDGYRQAEQTVAVGNNDTSTTVAIRRTPRIDIDASDREFTGQSFDIGATDEYGDPVPDAEVSRDGEVIGTTDANGEIEVTVDSTGPVNFTVSDDDASNTTTVRMFDPPEEGTPAGTPTPAATQTGTAMNDTNASTPATTTGGNGPGFTPVTAAAALALLAVVALRRR